VEEDPGADHTYNEYSMYLYAKINQVFSDLSNYIVFWKHKIQGDS
jgi:hypothetical protein